MTRFAVTKPQRYVFHSASNDKLGHEIITRIFLNHALNK